MKTLIEKAYGNLKLLLTMGENDVFISKRGELILQNDFVQVDNIIDIEYTIYFTYHQLLTSSDMGVLLNTSLIKKLDESIDMIFENKQFKELLEDDDFRCIIDDIDGKIDTLKESYFYKSPFFTLWKNSYNVYGYLKNIMHENNENIRKMFQITIHNLNKDITRDYYSDDEVDDEVDDDIDDDDIDDDIDDDDIDDDDDEVDGDIDDDDDEVDGDIDDDDDEKRKNE
jgi:hypothetical protein